MECTAREGKQIKLQSITTWTLEIPQKVGRSRNDRLELGEGHFAVVVVVGLLEYFVTNNCYFFRSQFIPRQSCGCLLDVIRGDEVVAIVVYFFREKLVLKWRNLSQLTINFKGVVHFHVSRSVFTEAIKHVQEVIERHVARAIVREHLTNSTLEWVFLGEEVRTLSLLHLRGTHLEFGHFFDLFHRHC